MHVHSSIAARIITVLLALVTCEAKAILSGQPYYDYYNRESQPRDLLGSAEKNHLVRAQETLRGKDPNRMASAEADLIYVLDYFPNHPRALFLLVAVSLDDKKPQVVDRYLGDAIRLFPNNASTWNIMGIYQARMGRVKNAIEAYERALQLDPNDVQTHYNLGLAYLESKQLVLANQQAQLAYALGAQFPGLRDKLTKAGAWNPGAAPAQKPTESSAPMPSNSTTPAPLKPPSGEK